jgi:AraC family ethanolamine operon transcriptional activator
VVDPGPAQVARLRWLLAQAMESIRIEPTVLVSPAALNSLQEDLVAVSRPVVSLAPTPVVAKGRALLPRSEIVLLVRQLVEQHPDECPSIEELAAAVDVSERTLRTVFLDYFGVPPRYYLTVRRMHQVRAVLRASDPETTTVTAVAARFGFWHFGRFAGEYRRLFGERPSETLYRRPLAVSALPAFAQSAASQPRRITA